MLLGPGLGVLGGGEPAQGRVGTVGVVLDPPVLDNDLSLAEIGEVLDVEQLVAYSTVEGLDEGVLPGRAGFDVGTGGARQPAPLAQSPGDHFGTVVHPQIDRRAAGSNTPSSTPNGDARGRSVAAGPAA